MNISIPNSNILKKISYNSFWEKIKQINTPIIEPIEGSVGLCRVTFLYRDIEKVKNVILGTYGLCSYDPKHDQLERIINTDIFYKSYIFPSDLKTIYCFSPNDELVNLADSDLFNCDLLPMVKNWQSDPFNPFEYSLPGWLILGEEEKRFSLLKLPKAIHSKWVENKNEIDGGEITHHSVNSHIFNLSRNILIYKPKKSVVANYRYPLITFFDGDAYLQFCAAATILDNLIDAEMIPPVIAVFISNPPPNTVTRWNDLTCNEPYINYIGKELIPWVHNNFPTDRSPEKNVIVGASFGGLAGMFLGLKHSDVIGNIISQSGAFFWRPQDEREDGWLIKQFSIENKCNLKIHLAVGCTENALTFNKGASILSGNRHMRDVLISKRYDISYKEYSGGHDYICWQDMLPISLIDIFKIGTPTKSNEKLLLPL